MKKTTVRRRAYALVCALLLALLPVWAGAETAVPVDYAACVQPDMASDTLKTPVTVATFVDGDTTHFLLPEGVMEKRVISGRYLAVNTPESTGKIEEYGRAASRYTREKLENAAAILIESDDAQWNLDTNGTRYLVWVWYRPADGEAYRNLNIELLQTGLAKANSSAQNRYGETCMAAIAQAKSQKLGIYSGQRDPDFYYGDAIELTLRELRLHPEQYENKKVACEGVITMNSGNSVYVEALDPESGLCFGMPVYYGFNLSGGGMEVLHVGNKARIVGTLQFYEAGGEYQLSGLTYRMMKPDDPGNIRKLGEGFAPVCAEIDLDELLNGSVQIIGEDDIASYDRGLVALATSVTLDGLTVEKVTADGNGAILSCVSGGNTIAVLASGPLPADEWTGRVISVRGVVTLRDGQYQIKAFTPDGLAILPE